MKNRKGQMGNLVPIMFTLVFIGILIGAGFIILQEFLEQDDFKNTVTVTNETTTAINTSGFISPNEEGVRTEGFVLTEAWDTSTGTAVTVVVTNFTMNANSGTLHNATMTTADGNLVGNAYNSTNISYTYRAGETAFLGVNETIDAMQTVPQLLGLIILIVMVGIILAIVFNVLPIGGRGGGA